MKIIDASVEIIPKMNALRKIELCGRVCYKSESRITEDSATAFVGNIIQRGHLSVLEHARLAIEDQEEYDQIYFMLMTMDDIVLSKGIESRIVYDDSGVLTINARDYLVLFPAAFADGSIASRKEATEYMTVRFICDRAIANELVRHRMFSFSQESTRYVNYKDGIEFIVPSFLQWRQYSADGELLKYRHKSCAAWELAMKGTEQCYIEMIADGRTPQEARSVLPMSTKTELIMTGTYRQWSEMLELRLDRAAHPQMRELMLLLVALPEFPKGIATGKQEA